MTKPGTRIRQKTGIITCQQQRNDVWLEETGRREEPCHSKGGSNKAETIKTIKPLPEWNTICCIELEAAAAPRCYLYYRSIITLESGRSKHQTSVRIVHVHSILHGSIRGFDPFLSPSLAPVSPCRCPPIQLLPIFDIHLYIRSSTLPLFQSPPQFPRRAASNCSLSPHGEGLLL